jgi:hypothetical protein
MKPAMLVKVLQQPHLEPGRFKQAGKGTVVVQDLVIFGPGANASWPDSIDVSGKGMVPIRDGDS